MEMDHSALATLADWKGKYADLPMDPADASLVWLAQHTGVLGILTIDLPKLHERRGSIVIPIAKKE